MLDKSMRKRVGLLARTLLNKNAKELAEAAGVSENTIYGYEACKFDSKACEELYESLYKDLNMHRIFTCVGIYNSFHTWEQLLDRRSNNGKKINS